MKPDPRVIFVLIFVLSTFALLIREDVMAMGFLLAFSLALALALRVRLGRILGRLKRLMWVMVLVVLARSLFMPAGAVLVSAWDIPLLTTGGLAMGALVVLRLLIFIVSAALLTIYRTRALIQAMVQMRLPYELAYMVSIALRFVPQFAENLRDSLIALQLRGIVIEELKLPRRLSLYTYLLLPAIVSALQQAKELAMSMEMRAFRAMPARISYYKLTLKGRDVMMLLGIAVLSAAAGWWML